MKKNYPKLLYIYIYRERERERDFHCHELWVFPVSLSWKFPPRRLCLKTQSRRLICKCFPYGPTGDFFERSSMVGSSISGANGSSMRHAKNIPCTNHHGTYDR